MKADELHTAAQVVEQAAQVVEQAARNVEQAKQGEINNIREACADALAALRRGQIRRAKELLEWVVA